MAQNRSLFPADFVWGTATSSYQIEGAVNEDGRGPSIWDTFSHTPGKVKYGQHGDVACDHYHRYADDLDLMQSLGVQSYRFSVAWPRIFPSGAGQPVQAGLDFYRRLIDGLRQRDIRPLVTLYHWDLPQALQDTGGWTQRDTAERFAEYAATMFEQLGDVEGWITHNEPWVAAFVGHYQGRHAPGLTDLTSAVRASHHLLLSHGLAAQALRASGAGRLGITLNLTPAYPASDSAADQAAAWRMDGYTNRWFLDPLFRGAYPEDILGLYTDHGHVADDLIQPGDLEQIKAPLDFLGVNYYFPHRVAASAEDADFGLVQTPPLGETSFRGWEVAPRAFYDLLTRITRDYGEVPIFITENGAAFADAPGPDGAVNDGQRVAYLHTHLSMVREAIAAGVPVRGYYAWSLLDNFEWAEGYDERFGIVWVDFETQRRTPKRSALWYRDVIARNGLEPLPADLTDLGERYLALRFG
jgi:beta-glucosidase